MKSNTIRRSEFKLFLRNAGEYWNTWCDWFEVEEALRELPAGRDGHFITYDRDEVWRKIVVPRKNLLEALGDRGMRSFADVPRDMFRKRLVEE